jgi:uncharacterized membrane protein
MMDAKRLSRLALVAALYVVLTLGVTLLAPGLNLGYGPIQVRLSEGLTMLALFDPLMPVALWLGCLMANLLGGLGPWDLILGPLLTLAAGYATWSLRKAPLLPWLPPIVFNALGVAAYLRFLLGFDFDLSPLGSSGPVAFLAAHPYWAMVVTIALGQTVAVVGFGALFIKVWKRAS